MSRHPDGAVARRHRVTVRFDDDERAELDRKRGDTDPSAFIRTLIHTAPTRKDRTDGPEH